MRQRGGRGVYFCGLGYTFTKNFNLDVTEGCVKGDRHDSNETYTSYDSEVLWEVK